MPVQMIELEEVMMVETSDETLEAAVKAQPKAHTQPGEGPSCPPLS